MEDYTRQILADRKFCLNFYSVVLRVSSPTINHALHALQDSTEWSPNVPIIRSTDGTGASSNLQLFHQGGNVDHHAVANEIFAGLPLRV